MSKQELNLELQVIEEFGDRNAGRDGLLVLQVEQWLKDGQPIGRRKLCLREYYTGKDGIRRPGKAKGFDLNDLETFFVNAVRIKELLSITEIQKPIFKPKQSDSMDDLGEIPF